LIRLDRLRLASTGRARIVPRQLAVPGGEGLADANRAPFCEATEGSRYRNAASRAMFGVTGHRTTLSIATTPARPAARG
jgi:hypothetical protein